MGKRVMKLTALIGAALVASAAVAAAQQPQPATPARSAARDSVVPLDRILAVVGDQVITQYDLQERLLAIQQQETFRPPQTEAEYNKLANEALNTLVDEEVLIQKAADLKVEVPEGDLSSSADQEMRRTRGRFPSEAEFRAELQKAGLGTPEEYKRFLMDQMRRVEVQRRVVVKLKQEGKMPSVSVPQADVEAAFNRMRATLPRRPATVTFRQIVVAPRATLAARLKARVKAESLLVEIKGGGDFERVAKRESADPGSKELGGDLGWRRRGEMVPEFEKWMFGLRPGDLSPVVETAHGFHIIRVDRVQPGEVKSRHVLVEATIDSADYARARTEADSAAKGWAAGVAFDTLIKRHHDPVEETSILTPIPRDSGLPPSYQRAFTNKKAGDIVVFEIPGAKGHPKYVVAQLATVEEAGEYTLADLKERVRSQLQQEQSLRRLIDNLRKERYVSIKPPTATASATPPPPDR